MTTTTTKPGAGFTDRLWTMFVVVATTFMLIALYGRVRAHKDCRAVGLYAVNAGFDLICVPGVKPRDLHRLIPEYKLLPSSPRKSEYPRA